VLVETLEQYYGGQPRIFGLVIGYGSASLTQVRRGCAVLRELIDELSGQGQPNAPADTRTRKPTRAG